MLGEQQLGRCARRRGLGKQGLSLGVVFILFIFRLLQPCSSSISFPSKLWFFIKLVFFFFTHFHFTFPRAPERTQHMASALKQLKCRVELAEAQGFQFVIFIFSFGCSPIKLVKVTSEWEFKTGGERSVFQKHPQNEVWGSNAAPQDTLEIFHL